MNSTDKPTTGLLHPDALTGSLDPADPIVLDPHTKAADYSLTADPTGLHDPIGRPGIGVHAETTAEAKAEGVAGSVQQKAGDVADRVAGLGQQALDHASNITSDVRGRLGDAADQARGRASDAYDGARTWVSGTHREHMQRIDDAVVRGSDGLNRSRTAVEQFVTENPILVGVVGVAAGLLLGALIPRTKQEDRNIGPYADEMRDQGLRYAREFTSRGREFVETALDPDNLNAAADKVAAKAPAGTAARPARSL